MRSFIVAALSLSIVASSAMAGTDSAPLAPGKPAGVNNAQIDTTTAAVMIGIVGLIMGIAFSTASSGNPGQPVTPTTVPTTGTA